MLSLPLLPLLPLLQNGASRLAELEYFFLGGEGRPPAAAPATAGSSGGSYDAEAKVKALWVWDLSQDLAAVTDDPALRRK